MFSFNTDLLQCGIQSDQKISVPILISIPSLAFLAPISQKNNLNRQTNCFQPDSSNILNNNMFIQNTISPKIKDGLSKVKINKFKEKIMNMMIKQTNIAEDNMKNTCKRNQRVHFTKQEDEKLKELVKIYGIKNWSLISSLMVGRTAKQCRDRYSNYLVPGFFQGEWSKEEDELLMKLYNEYGSKWSIIQTHFPNRSSNSIKNRWYYFLRKNNEFLPVDGYKNVDSVEEGNITQTTNKIDVQLDVFELINEGENNNKTSKSTLNEEFNYNIDNISNSDFNKSILSQDVKLNEEENIFILNNENKETSNDEWIVYN